MYAHRPTHVDIDLAALQHNYHFIRQQMAADRQLLSVVKADAYGHGAVPVAQTLERAGAELLGVAIAEEGLELRQAGIELPILMLGGPWPGQEEILIENDLQVAVFEVGQLLRLQAAAERLGKQCHCHLKIDTGMGRLGVRYVGLKALLGVLARCPRLCLAGVMTHFALADCPEQPLTAEQLRCFEQALTLVRSAGFQPRYIHAANSLLLSGPV